MPTEAQKVEKAKRGKQTKKETPTIILKTGRDERDIPDVNGLRHHVEAGGIAEGDFKEAAAAKKACQAAVKSIVEAEGYLADIATVHFIAAEYRATVRANDDKPAVSDPERLKEILGQRFDDLVTTKTTYTPEPKLLAIAEDEDDPLSAAVLKCLRTGGRKISVKFS